MPRDTGDTVEQYVDSPDIGDRDVALELAQYALLEPSRFNIEPSILVANLYNDRYRNEGENMINASDVTPELINTLKNRINGESDNYDELAELELFTPSTFGAPRRMDIGCAYKGVKTVVEEDNEMLYIPSSDYCYVKVFNKYLELNNIIERVSIDKLASDTNTKLKYDMHILNDILPCKIKCDFEKSGKHSTLCKKNTVNGVLPCKIKCDFEKSGKHSALCKKNKVNRGVFMMPTFRLAVVDGVVVSKRVGKKGSTNSKYAIGLLHFSNNQYHSVLIKNVLNCKLPELKPEDIAVRITVNKEINIIGSSVREESHKESHRYCVSYDIETYTKEITVCNKSKNAKPKTAFRLVPYALGYRVVDMKTGEFVSDYVEVIIDTPYENLYDKFFESLSKNDDINKYAYKNKSMQVFAHNGARFDNIYVKTATNITILSNIQKGSEIKCLQVQHKDGGITYSFKDTYPFVLQPLGEACETFKTSDKKVEFDIAGKPFEWYEANRILECGCDNTKNCEKCEKINWRYYMQHDVDGLASLMHKIETMYRDFGVSITNFTGLPGAAYHVMNGYCTGMQKFYVAKDSGLSSFMKQSLYGGRVLCWKQKYEALDELGMISIDMNSLYPSAMAKCSFPTGKPQKFNVDDENASNHISKFNNFKHYIVEAEIGIPNIKKPIHPYKTEKGNLIYPSNQTIVGVYNDVDLREMLKDGYIVKNVFKGIYWSLSARIFTNLISDMYDKRSYYKNLGEENPEYAKEYIIKILLNSMFGKFAETVADMIMYYDVKNKDKKKNKKYVGRTIDETNLKNGQTEVHIKLDRPQRKKPVYIAGYILSYSRAIVNELIRTIGTENIYYSDTDSLYVEKKVLVEKELKTSSALCGFKNDYGKGSKITYAIFLDLKRYYLELENVNEKCKKTKKWLPVTYKAKFNGLSFKSLKFRRNYFDQLENENETISYSLLKGNPEAQKQFCKNLYIELLAGANKKTKKGEKKSEKEMFTLAFDRWKRVHNGVEICEDEVVFCVDTSTRGNYENYDFYAIGYDKKKPVCHLANNIPIGTLEANCAKNELMLYTTGCHSSGELCVKMNRPLMLTKTGNEKIDNSVYLTADYADSFNTKYYYAHHKENGRIVREEVLHIMTSIEKQKRITNNKNEKGVSIKDRPVCEPITKFVVHKVNAFGLCDRAEVSSLNELGYSFVRPLIAIMQSPETEMKYGRNLAPLRDVMELFKTTKKGYKNATMINMDLLLRKTNEYQCESEIENVSDNSDLVLYFDYTYLTNVDNKFDINKKTIHSDVHSIVKKIMKYSKDLHNSEDEIDVDYSYKMKKNVACVRVQVLNKPTSKADADYIVSKVSDSITGNGYTGQIENITLSPYYELSGWSSIGSMNGTWSRKFPKTRSFTRVGEYVNSVNNV